MRDWLTMVVCNFMLRHVATKDYGQKIELMIRQGMLHAHSGGPYIVSKEGRRDV